jgi:hypothetical protein
LESLELSQVDLYEILPSADNLDVFLCVRSLRLDFCKNQTAGILSRLSRIFPQLRTLDVNHATNQVAKMIFQKMHSLTSLTLDGDELSDEGITGIPKITGDQDNDLVLCTTANGNVLRQYPFIGSMPRRWNCVRLVISYDSCFTISLIIYFSELRYLKLDAFRLTEASIKHGIVHCTSLHFVSMDTRAGQGDPSATLTRTFKLAGL